MASRKKNEEGLIEREALFVDNYFLTNHNASLAYAMAHGKKDHMAPSVRSAASAYMKKPAIAAAIARRIKEYLGDENLAKIKAEVVRQTAARALYDPADVINSHGQLRMPIDELQKRGLSVAIDGIKTKVTDGGMEVDVKLANKERALDSLNKFAKLVDEKSDVEASITIVVNREDVAL